MSFADIAKLKGKGEMNIEEKERGNPLRITTDTVKARNCWEMIVAYCLIFTVNFWIFFLSQPGLNTLNHLLHLSESGSSRSRCNVMYEQVGYQE